MDASESTRASLTKQALMKAFEYIAGGCNKKGRKAALLMEKSEKRPGNAGESARERLKMHHFSA